MSIANEITRLTTIRNNIRTKLIDLGIISDQAATLNDCYTGLSEVTKKASTTYDVSTSNQTIASGQYLNGAQTIRAVTTSGIDATNIKDGAVVKVGDAGSATRIKNVTGTFTDASTVSSGQTAAAASQMLSGYSAWVDGTEVKGSIASKTSSNMTVSGATVTAPAGYYASNSSKAVASGNMAVNTPSVNNDTGVVTASATLSQAGYISSALASKTYQIPVSTNSGKTLTPGTSQVTAISKGKFPTSSIYVAGDANLVSANIKKGVSIFGVSGKSSVIETSDATAVASNIFKGKTAYANGTKLTGTAEIAIDDNILYLPEGLINFEVQDTE